MSLSSQLNPLTSVSCVDGRYHHLTRELSQFVSEAGLIGYRLKVEAMWLSYQLNHPDLSAHLPPPSTVKNHAGIISFLDTLTREKLSPEVALKIKTIEKTTGHDVKAVEYYLQNALAELGAPDAYLALIHFACTSEDINNLAYGLMLVDVRELLVSDMTRLVGYLQKLAREYASAAMLSRTHGQSASPTTMGKELAVFGHRLSRQIRHLKKQEILGKWAGAVGNYNAHLVAYPKVNWPKVAEEFIASLSPDSPIKHTPVVTQIEPHDALAELCDTLRRFDSIAMDLCQDIWSYISINYFSQKLKASETGSSTMPHKVNPINFENAEGNLGLARTLASHFTEKLTISRWQRDLSDSTVLRSLGIMVAYHQIAMKNLLTGLDKLILNPAVMQRDLDGAWEVLSEAVQTALRAQGVKDSYEQLKELTRGKVITEEGYVAMVKGLRELDQDVKKRLLSMKPCDYIGLAPDLASKSF